MGNSPRERTWQVEAEPIMANQSDHASRRQCRLGSFSGGVDRPYGKKTNMRETSERSAVLRESLRVIYAAVFSHSGGTEAKGGEIGGRRCYFSRVGSVFAPPESTCQAEQKPIMANQLARATLAVSPWFFCRRSRPPIRKTAELPNAAPLWASVLRSVLGGVFSFRQNED